MKIQTNVSYRSSSTRVTERAHGRRFAARCRSVDLTATCNFGVTVPEITPGFWRMGAIAGKLMLLKIAYFLAHLLHEAGG
ncbi:hypothetical protein [Stenotrophomonas maltophilia]|uniref:hypothetical protein n=1 Tax=Stenotrophomonas maltophilia TaxID=40324 RepID=UPI000A9EB23E|nr:hypothetical protein [Stenotrophomonas maltophilia]ELK2665920.1 hypothetical protein [Stenotrophomonas maltophilia]MBH1377517.1 hypothetical protein [Stenotrophomonas maltophilia]MBH1440268.1 hypothetical protein [Stenotrophomonas maltophilia]MBH1559545.1 hypothetical protein [Stenotrophomonas maltophilia]MBN4986381.1 hypothetical protein [Stenotrophomonas maltophilia]